MCSDVSHKNWIDRQIGTVKRRKIVTLMIKFFHLSIEQEDFWGFDGIIHE